MIKRACIVLLFCGLSLYGCIELANTMLPFIHRADVALNFGKVLIAVCWLWCGVILVTIFRFW